MSDGSSDLSYLWTAADTIAQHAPADSLIVTKSTVPVGTGKKLAARLRETAMKVGRAATFRVASNPEFLAEGRALPDFMEPQRTVFGAVSYTHLDVYKRQPSIFNWRSVVCFAAREE